MPVQFDRSTGIQAAAGEHSDLLYYRMAMLGLDLRTIESRDSKTAEKIRGRCANCGCWEACAVDLKRDPNNPVWEAYCPNAGTFSTLAKQLWAAS